VQARCNPREGKKSKNNSRARENDLEIFSSAKQTVAVKVEDARHAGD
jgi:hypothetical protein